MHIRYFGYHNIKRVNQINYKFYKLRSMFPLHHSYATKTATALTMRCCAIQTVSQTIKMLKTCFPDNPCKLRLFRSPVLILKKDFYFIYIIIVKNNENIPFALFDWEVNLKQRKIKIHLI